MTLKSQGLLLVLMEARQEPPWCRPPLSPLSPCREEMVEAWP